jgi:hypothetical protein
MMTQAAKWQTAGIDQPAHCAIKIQGNAGDGLAEWFGPLTSTRIDDGDPPTTLLSGIVTDQAGLVGLIRRLHGLGIVLLSVERSIADNGVEGEGYRDTI